MEKLEGKLFVLFFILFYRHLSEVYITYITFLHFLLKTFLSMYSLLTVALYLGNQGKEFI